MNDTFPLEINDKYTRMCDLNLNEGKIELLSLGVRETVPRFLSAGDDSAIDRQAEVIADLHASLNLPKQDVRVIIPDSYTYSQITQMPRLKEKELLSAIRYQADEFIPMPLSETNLDMEVLKDDDSNNKSLLLIIATPKLLADKIGATISATGLKPVSLENELSSIGRLFAEVLKPQSKGTLIVNFGLGTTSIYILDGKDSLVRIARTINIGLNLFIKDVSINMNWNEAKVQEALRSIGLADSASYTLTDILNPLTNELMVEIEKLLTLAKDRHALDVDFAFLCNFDGAVAHLAETIQKQFNITTKQVQLTNHLVQNQVSKAFEKDISSFIPVISANIQ